MLSHLKNWANNGICGEKWKISDMYMLPHHFCEIQTDRTFLHGILYHQIIATLRKDFPCKIQKCPLSSPGWLMWNPKHKALPNLGKVMKKKTILREVLNNYEILLTISPTRLMANSLVEQWTIIRSSLSEHHFQSPCPAWKKYIVLHSKIIWFKFLEYLVTWVKAKVHSIIPNLLI